MNKQDVATLYEYNRWANGRILDAVEKLDPAAFLKNLGNSFASIHATLVQVAGAEWAWLRRWQGDSPKALPTGEYPTVAALRERFHSIDRERDAFLVGVSHEQLQQPFDYRDLAGNPMRLLLVQSLQHVVNHGTYHRGQVTTMLRQLGATPVSTDMSRFFLDRQSGK
jgi:uncharacterized damage-inducible protein DinB